MESRTEDSRISTMDARNFLIIRASVDVLLKRVAEDLSAGDRVLDVAPQDHGGIAPYIDDSIEVVTFDVDPGAGATITGDICVFNEVLEDAQFDAVVCTEVLEHVDNPFGAIDEILRILKKGGRLYASSPFDFRIHGPLPDNWRITEHGWRVLTKAFDEVAITSLENPQRFLMPIHYTVIATK